MGNSLLACVADTKIWIDMYSQGLLKAAFHLPWQWNASNLVIDELQQIPCDAKLVRRGVQSVSLSGNEMHTVAKLRARHKQVSVADLSTLVLAKNRGFMLLAGDENLQQLAQSKNIVSHGMLWMLEKIIQLGLHWPDWQQKQWLSQSIANDSNKSRSIKH